MAEVVKLTARKNELYTALFTQLYTFFCAVFYEKKKALAFCNGKKSRFKMRPTSRPNTRKAPAPPSARGRKWSLPRCPISKSYAASASRPFAWLHIGKQGRAIRAPRRYSAPPS